MNWTIEQIAIAAGFVITIVTFCSLCYRGFRTATKRLLTSEIDAITKELSSLRSWNMRQQKDIETSFTEKQIMLRGILACLKGLREQGCNGPVSDAIGEIDEFLFIHAHEGVSRKV